MKISVDNQIVKWFSGDIDRLSRTPLSEGGHLTFSWPSLLEYLGLGKILSRFPSFDKDHPLFKASVSALSEVENPEDLFYIYDSLFTEMLKQVKSLPEVDRDFLLRKIGEKKEKLSFWEMEKVLSPALSIKERAFEENGPHAMHDLILYLAWDRMCVSMSRLFDFQSNDPIFLQNLRKLKWCLIESYQHIASQGRTSPSFYRLMEALFYYQMREEHLQLHAEHDWILLTKSFAALKNQNELVDCFYIDHSIGGGVEKQEQALCHLTLDDPEIVECRLALASYMLNHLKKEFPQCNYTLNTGKIIHLT